MKKLLICLVILMIGFIIAQTNFNTYYKINLNYDKGEINISSINIEFFHNEVNNSFGFYFVEVLDNSGEILNISFFDVPNEILWDGVNPETGEIGGGGLIEFEEVSFEVYVPYYENAKEIAVYDENLTEISRKEVREYSKQGFSNSELSVEENESVAKDEKDMEEENLLDRLNEYWWILLIILVILIIVFVYLLMGKEN